MMKLIRWHLLLLGLFVWQAGLAQTAEITLLDEISLSDVALKRNSRERKIQTLNDSILRNNDPALSTLLKFNTPIHLRENGYGMVASASFRGTSAQQTAVVWNGININSQFTGQTDFNTIATGNFDQVAIRPGGGSVLYGSGAIGGSIHLNNKLSFDGKFQNFAQLQAGSFDTYNALYRGKISTEKTSLRLSVSHNSSRNDYEYWDTGIFNENGDFFNTGLSASVAHWINETNILKFHSNFFNSQRAFSGTLTAPSKSKFRDQNSRNLLEWKALLGKMTSSLKLAYLEEHYKYYENRDREEHNFGNAGTGIIKYEFNYEIKQNLQLTAVGDLQKTRGEGSNIGVNSRSIGSAALLLQHRLGKFSYQASLRKEATENYSSPLLYGLHTSYTFSENYQLRFSHSKNFRIPGFNDLYWYAGGNLELDPETSTQWELGQTYKFKNFEFDLAAFLIDVENLLRWVPGRDGLWRPENTAKVQNKGLEASLSWQKQIKNHQFNFTSNYAYTLSEDEQSGLQLIYTPMYKLGASAGYSFKRFSMFYQFMHTGEVFISSDNNYSLPAFQVSNLGLAYSLGKNEQWQFQLQLRNLFDAEYMNMPARPMPGRHFNSSISFKF
ncbi:TonB-dependent receptor [Salegentibacter sp. HM20]